MRIPRSVRHPIEALRTAPVGFAKVAISLGFLSLGAVHLYSHTVSEQTANIEDSIVDISTDIVLMGVGIYHGRDGLNKVGDSIAQRNRMEATLERTGFNERIMSETLDTYCDRQATLVACDKFDFRQEYLGLVNTTDRPMAFSNLPHC